MRKLVIVVVASLGVLAGVGMIAASNSKDEHPDLVIPSGTPTYCLGAENLGQLDERQLTDAECRQYLNGQ